MRQIEVEIEKELSEMVEATQLELASVKDLLGFAYSTTQYDIPSSRIDKLEKEFKELNAKYNLLKQQVEERVVPEDYDRNKTSWNLDFKTYKVKVTEND